MAYGVCIPNKTWAQDLDILNRTAKSAANPTVDIENGSVVVLATKSTTSGELEVWNATCPATATLAAGLWMVASPEIVVTVSGSNQFKGIDPDPRNFKNLAGKTFDTFKVSVGDIVTLTEDAVGGSKSTGDYAIAADGQYKLQWASGAISGCSFKVLDTTYVSIPSGTLGETQRVTAYRMICTAIA